MGMKVLKRERRLCICCMQEHEVKTVQVRDHTIFKEVEVSFDAVYEYCELADEFYENEEQMAANDIRVKDAYRKSQGLLSSKEIADIRAKYGITQSDFSTLLGWGGKTITRYESHQVQDRAHDSILKKIERDPEWYLALLQAACGTLSEDAYRKYFGRASSLLEASQDYYLRKAIKASYAGFLEKGDYHGNTELSLDKVVDVIRYFASSSRITSLYKVKLMKLMWYADALSFKRTGHAITGLVYQALPMGAVPVAHDSIIDLKGVPCEEVDMGEANAYHFCLKEETSFPSLTEGDISILDEVIEKLGKMTKKEIVSFMHRERAYIETPPRDVISFIYAEDLQL